MIFYLYYAKFFNDLFITKSNIVYIFCILFSFTFIKKVIILIYFKPRHYKIYSILFSIVLFFTLLFLLNCQNFTFIFEFLNKIILFVQDIYTFENNNCVHGYHPDLTPHEPSSSSDINSVPQQDEEQPFCS